MNADVAPAARSGLGAPDPHSGASDGRTGLCGAVSDPARAIHVGPGTTPGRPGGVALDLDAAALAFEIFDGGTGRHAYDAYWCGQLVARRATWTRIGLAVSMRFTVRRWRRAVRHAR